MRIETDYSYFLGDEDWALACVYLTRQEIAERGLVPTKYNGKRYDWITLPEREDGVDECLVAAYGGAMSDICCWRNKSNTATMTTAEAAYYNTPEALEYGQDGTDTSHLPKDIFNDLHNAIKEAYGTYAETDFSVPNYAGGEWVEGELKAEAV